MQRERRDLFALAENERTNAGINCVDPLRDGNPKGGLNVGLAFAVEHRDLHPEAVSRCLYPLDILLLSRLVVSASFEQHSYSGRRRNNPSQQFQALWYEFSC